jgi:hypothetical protein
VGHGDRRRGDREAGADLRPALDVRVQRARSRGAVFELAKIMGSSVRMIERHYGALLDGRCRDQRPPGRSRGAARAAQRGFGALVGHGLPSRRPASFNRKPRCAGLFGEADDGTRTHDLLHGKGTRRPDDTRRCRRNTHGYAESPRRRGALSGRVGPPDLTWDLTSRPAAPRGQSRWVNPLATLCSRPMAPKPTAAELPKTPGKPAHEECSFLASVLTCRPLTRTGTPAISPSHNSSAANS